MDTNILSNLTKSSRLTSRTEGSQLYLADTVADRIADTGRLLVASNYFSPMIVGMQVCAGYGGLIYEGLNDGHIMASQVTPALKTSGNSTTRKNS
jgi:hypothetical protein